MDIQKIKAIIGDYSNLIELARTKIKILEKVDYEMYGTGRGIETITIEGDEVSVRCDDTCRGYYDYFYNYFPVDFLAMEDADLEVLVETQRKERLIAQQNKKIEEEKQKEAKKQQEELKLLEELKKKYPNK